MSRPVALISAVLAALTALFLFVAFVLYSPSYGPFSNGRSLKAASIRPKESLNPPVSANSTEALQSSNGTGLPPEVEQRVEQLSQVIPTYFVNLKGRSKSFPALVLKVKPLGGGKSAVFLLSIYPVNWSSVTLRLNGYNFGPPDKVYLCRGLLVAEYDIGGIPPAEVQRGEVEQFGALAAVKSYGAVSYEPFTGECSPMLNGFVFDFAGELAGVCFGGNFISADKIYSAVPRGCRLIYTKEGAGNGDLQG
ncbi:hypothetical protein [Thermovibrio ammonificans]